MVFKKKTSIQLPIFLHSTSTTLMNQFPNAYNQNGLCQITLICL